MISLDLKIFEKHTDADAYRFGPSFTPYAIVGKEKRFATSELMAQYWFGGDMGHSPIFRAALYRFACLPHYDEVEEKQ